MKITPQILSIPPYISTSWKNIASLHVEDQNLGFILVVTLHSGTRIEVPSLDPGMVEAIFAAHARHLEQDERASQPKTFPKAPLNFPMGASQLLSLELPLKSGFPEMGGFGTVLQHNGDLSATPDLPPDILEKITLLSKSIGVDDPGALPKPEPHCNCLHCQIAKAMQTGLAIEETAREEVEEIVKDEELTFRSWDVAKSNDQLYVVTNPLDEREHYTVFLGEPIGCTCGENHCEHIKAVLNS